ncbi:MAG TPA: hypothetical protein VM688_01615 [Nocardioidaceae bacterium]|jgi:hypothetical protein|nr:hypothetical protein [Nocardioidaceae bacterium]
MAPFEVSDVCGFSITVVSHQRGFEITSADGRRSTVHITEQDVFTTNGATLRSRPFTFTIHFLRDAEGQTLHAISTGQIIVVPVAPGVTFRAAGRFDFVPRTRTLLWFQNPEEAGTKTPSAPLWRPNVAHLGRAHSRDWGGRKHRPRHAEACRGLMFGSKPRRGQRWPMMDAAQWDGGANQT